MNGWEEHYEERSFIRQVMEFNDDNDNTVAICYSGFGLSSIALWPSALPLPFADVVVVLQLFLLARVCRNQQ